MPQRIVTFVSAIGIWGLLLFLTPSTRAAALSSSANDSNADVCELAPDNEPYIYNHLGIFDFPGSPFGRIPDSEINSSPIRNSQVMSAHRRYSIFERNPHTPIIDNSPKTDAHLQGRSSSVDYYVFTLRRIIIWFTYTASRNSPNNALAIHTTEHFILITEFWNILWHNTIAIQIYTHTICEASTLSRLRLNHPPKPRQSFCHRSFHNIPKRTSPPEMPASPSPAPHLAHHIS